MRVNNYEQLINYISDSAMEQFRLQEEETFKALKVKKFVRLGDEQVARGNHKEAASLYKEALKFDPSSSEALYSIGCLFTLEPYIDYTKASEIAQMALKSDPNHKGARALYANTLLALDKYSDALPQFEQILEQLPLSEQLPMKVQMSICYEQLEDYQKAEATLKQMLEQCDDGTGKTLVEKNALLSDAHQVLGRVLQNLNKEEEAKHHFIISHVIDPEQ